MDFSGQRALVTGAGKGIGYATAKMLRERGADVVGLTRSESDRAGLEALGCTAVICDLADADATRRATIAAQPIDLLVNNAGTTELQPFLDTTAEAFDHLMAVNARAR